MNGKPDLIHVSRTDIAALLAAVASGRLAASEAHSADAATARRIGERAIAREREFLSARLRHNGDQLLEAAGAIVGAEDPLATLANAMPLVRERIGKGEERHP